MAPLRLTYKIQKYKNLMVVFKSNQKPVWGSDENFRLGFGRTRFMSLLCHGSSPGVFGPITYTYPSQCLALLLPVTATISSKIQSIHHSWLPEADITGCIALV